MAPQKVTEKILTDARKEAEEILNGYKKEATKIKHEYEDKIAAKSEQIESEVEALKKKELLRTVSQKKLEFEKEIVAQKRKYIKNIIEEALKELPKHKEYFSFLKALMEKSGEKEGELLINKRDWQRYSTDIDTFAAKEGLNYKVTTNNDIMGGIVIKKGKTTYLGSLDLIGELLRDELTIAVSQKLY